jgi:two-component system, OmpR family, sensor histidine kinase KdpD
MRRIRVGQGRHAGPTLFLRPDECKLAPSRLRHSRPACYPEVNMTPSQRSTAGMSAIRKYAPATGVVAVCALLGWASRAVGLATANIAMIFFAGVVLAAVRGGRGPSALTAALGVLVFDYFFVEPLFRFAPSDAQYVVDFAVMLATGLLISELTARLEAQLRAAQQQERRTARLYEMTRRLNDLAGSDHLIADAAGQLAETFDGEVAIYLQQPSGEVALRLGNEATDAHLPVNKIAAQWVVTNNRPAGLGTDTYPGATAFFVPMVGSQRTFGALGVRPSDIVRFLEADERRMLETCGNLLALSIERDQSLSASQQAEIQIETERLRSALLSSVSHDLRTPLATIAVTVSSLLDGNGEQNWAAKREILETVVDESRQLGHQVDNLLDMARLDAGGIVLDRDGQVVEELVGVALSRMRHELKGRRVVACIPGDLPLVWAASELIEQVLVNLLENAIRYTPPDSPIEILAAQLVDRVEIRVADHGPGLPAGREAQIFEKFVRGKGVVADGQRGVGLGLAICRSIVRAHGGEISATNRAEGGAEFLITLPCAAQNSYVQKGDLLSPADC